MTKHRGGGVRRGEKEEVEGKCQDERLCIPKKRLRTIGGGYMYTVSAKRDTMS